MITKRKTEGEQRKKRMSVSLPTDLHQMLERIAKEQKVSLGWVVRDAAEKYVSDKWPLLASKG